MADRAHLFKTSVKQLALKHEIIASFMAKPWADLPGCSGHIHFSLKDIAKGINLFAKDGGEEAEAEEGRLGKIGRWFVAGVLEGLVSFPLFRFPEI